MSNGLHLKAREHGQLRPESLLKLFLLNILRFSPKLRIRRHQSGPRQASEVRACPLVAAQGTAPVGWKGLDAGEATGPGRPEPPP